jgi:hypothetical protein
MGTVSLSGAASAEGGAWHDGFWEAFTQGKPTLNIRGRIEIAEQANLAQSQAYTLRTRLGYGTQAWHGFSLYADMENIAGAATENYWDLIRTNTAGQTSIADPTHTELNQAFLKFSRESWLDTKIVGGRQRIIMDDARFIGNVGWRQNEQTFDAALGSSSLGVDDLTVTYSYIGYVRRIFGDRDFKKPGDKGPATLDWRSNSHVIHAGHKGWKYLQPAAFIYLLEFSNKRQQVGVTTNSSATYGLRGTGSVGIGDKLNVGYGASYAIQTEYGNNPASYTANYAKLDGSLGGIPVVGKLALGWEYLGGDGTSRFVTPLATAHKFNGWADVFLNNGGGNGLSDLYFEWAPSLPWKLKTRLLYHRFTAANGGAKLGNEFDALLKRSFGKHFDLLFKSAYFKAEQGAALTDIWRVWMDATIKF